MKPFRKKTALAPFQLSEFHIFEENKGGLNWSCPTFLS